MRLFPLLFSLFLALASSARAEVTVTRDIEYARVGETSLALDLYLPSGPVQPLLLVYVHGGGWGAGSKRDMPLKGLLARGFAVASVDYRLSTQATFPAQVHDLKAALRFLRAKGSELGVESRQIAIIGSSAGGHLAALVGVTNGVAELEGTVGAFPGEPSQVQAIVSFFGASDLQTILAQSTPHGVSVRTPALGHLLGGQPEEKPYLARLASPVAHVGPGDPPLLLIHGDADPQMPFAQSEELQHAYTAAGLRAQLIPMPGYGHGGPEFYDDRRSDEVAAFLTAALAPPGKPAPAHADVSYGPHPHQLLDVYLPPGEEPAPVVLWFGGIWEAKKGVPDAARLLSHHLAVISVETRTLKDAQSAEVTPPVSWLMADATRVVQFVRSKAQEWHLDPQRIAVGGSSQGSLPALYVGCAGERAQPEAADPVERESTQVLGVVAHRSQPSIDPAQMQEWVPGVEWGSPALGPQSFRESLQRREELLPIIRAWSPEALLHPGAATIYFEYNWGLTQPEGVKEMDYKVHSPAWGLGFQKLAQKAGVTCLVKYPGHPADGYEDFYDFLIKTLQAPGR